MDLPQGVFDLAAPFDVDRVVFVNQDVGNGRVFEQRLEWSKTEEFVLNVVNEAFPFRCGQGHGFLRQHIFGKPRDFGVHLLRRERRQLRQVHPVDQGSMQARLYLLKAMGSVFNAAAVTVSVSVSVSGEPGFSN